MVSIAELPKYEVYRDSGVDWLGEIPLQWSVERIKNLGTVINGATPSSGVATYWDGEVVWVAPTDINNVKYLFDSARRLTKRGYESCGTTMVPAGSLIVTCRAPIGKVTIAGVSLCTNQGCKSIVLRDLIEKRFLYFVFSVVPEKLNSIGSGTTFLELSSSALKDFPVTLPPFEEQVLIATFLDKKTTQIDEAIAIKEQQIALLKERKQIIIQKAVTQGLDPNVPMKDSGVDWIGSIPAHWDVVRFKNLFSQSRLPVQKDDGVVTSYRDGQVTLRSNRRLDGYTEAIIEGGYQGIRKGQLVLNSMDAFEGAIGVSESDGKCTPEYVICDPNRAGISQYYFAYLLREMALAKYIQVICNAVRQRAVRIRYNNLASRFMVVPPASEQAEIVKFIEVEKIKTDDGIAQLKSQIEKLKEYKTTLINSAVTGKIKVTPEMVGMDRNAQGAVEA
ncbi:restriction endonuclease subunit S [Hahella sp. KA22]|uniref:restriction endonuclease subunit S n=1 Tax=Hahella sp. KA22 TaxID=1628392 RepID=UPI000FDF3B0D|nr:restriction endonuclease subunit S [Hahella sp. KA22]AZZ90629.1 restriction endonuclease subunit S [Hahella sp. KA22]QAY54000.1 restriction endonuclease subunit S [Hahella sp. KA22]